jgi:predicted  nucleic acid-binding Zn-ribbon protein
MDYELLHEVSLIDKEILKLERTKVDKEIIKELNAFKNKHKILKAHYENEVQRQNTLNLKTKNITKLIDEKTSEMQEHENNLYSTGNARTIETCQAIIEKLSLEIKELEDEVYTTMNTNENLSKDNTKLVAEVNEIRSSYNKILKKYKKHQDDYDQKINVLKEKRKLIFDKVTIDAQKIYEDIKGELGFGMSEVKRDICTGCNVDVPVVIINEVKYTKKLIKCPTCNRLLYVIE